MNSAVIEAVAGGTETIETCPGSEHERIRSDLVALTPGGTVVLGEIATCETCGDAGSFFHCAACETMLVFNGELIFRHVADNHGERVDG